MLPTHVGMNRAGRDTQPIRIMLPTRVGMNRL